MTRRSTVKRWVCAVVLAGAMVGGAPTAARAQGDEALVVGVSGLGSSMDVQVACDSVTWSALRMVHDPLLYINDQSEVKPWLAESYRQINATTWQFKLRSGVTFHNGEPFNAAAVKFSLERFNNPRVCLRTTFQSIKQVDVVNDQTVNVVLTAPDWSIINLLATWADMLPPRAAADMGTYGAKPIGTGPYVAESWTPGDRVSLRSRLPSEPIVNRSSSNCPRTGSKSLVNAIRRPFGDQTGSSSSRALNVTCV